MRALVLSNMLPDASHPERGSFVRDQVAALRALPDVHVELLEFAPGPRALALAPFGVRRRRAAGAGAHEPRHYDVVHAHFGLTAWPALAARARVRALTLHGTDLLHPRTRLVTLAALPLMDLVACASNQLTAHLPRRMRERAAVLPCGVDVDRFRPLARERARNELGLDGDAPFVLFPADPARAEKRHDRALELCESIPVTLRTLGGVAPARVPLWVNAANAVLVPSEREGFGLAVLESLACAVPVLATPVGVHAQALANVPGSLCAEFDLQRWRAALEPHLRAAPQCADSAREASASAAQASGAAGAAGQMRASAMRFSARGMAENVLRAWRTALRHAG